MNPNVAKNGGRQRHGAKSEAGVGCHNPLATQDLAASGFPEGKKDGEKSQGRHHEIHE